MDPFGSNITSCDSIALTTMLRAHLRSTNRAVYDPMYLHGIHGIPGSNTENGVTRGEQSQSGQATAEQ